MITQQDMFAICRSPLFEGYSPFALAAALETLGARRMTFKSGEVLADGSKPLEFLGLVVTGHLHVYDLSFKNRRHLTRIIAPGQTIGTALVVTHREEAPVSVNTRGECVVVAFPLPCIRRAQAAKHEARFFENLNALVGEELLESWRNITIMSCTNTAERLMLYLRDRSEREGTKTIVLGATEAEFANYLGAWRTALLRVFRKLVDEGLFTYKRGVITLK